MLKIILIDRAVFLLEWCEYVQDFGWIFCGRSAKTAILLFVGFLKIKNSLASFSLIFQNSSPMGFSWQNRKKSVSSVLKMNSWYLQSLALKQASELEKCTPPHETEIFPACRFYRHRIIGILKVDGDHVTIFFYELDDCLCWGCPS